MLDANSKTWARHQKSGSFLFLMEIISSLGCVPKKNINFVANTKSTNVIN